MITLLGILVMIFCMVILIVVAVGFFKVLLVIALIGGGVWLGKKIFGKIDDWNDSG